MSAGRGGPEEPRFGPRGPGRSQPGGDREPGEEDAGGSSGDASPDVVVCDICGNEMYGSHCKLVCPVCGYTRDCSDP